MRFLLFCILFQISLLHSQPESDYARLLGSYVSNEGKVDYKGFIREREVFESYLKFLSENAPRDTWTANEQKAYWINVYNAFTIKLIMDNYPVSSIKDLHPDLYIPGLNSVWHLEFFEIDGASFDLDRIEHRILRKQYHDPRIHFAINCASKSCPKLRNEPYEAEKLEDQLEDQTRFFINDTKQNKLQGESVEISRIFSWFESDFDDEGGIVKFINRYAYKKIDENAGISYLRYDWSLNE